MSDADGALARLYDVKWPVLKVAGRWTFVIGEERRVLKVQEGGEAIDPGAAVKACPLRKKSPPPAAVP